MVAKKWRMNLHRSNEQSLVVKGDLPAPRGYELTTAQDQEDASVNMTQDKLVQAKQRQVMNIAYGPGKGLLTTAFMLWMSGSSIQIFSIMMTGMALLNPIKALVNANEPFRPFEKEEGVDTRIAKLIYISLQVLALGVGLYKCSTMGLLPLTSADWIEYLPKVVYSEKGISPITGINEFVGY